MILIAAITLTCSAYSFSDIEIAYASNSLPNDLEKLNSMYTSTDSIYGTDLTIREYTEKLYNTKTYLSLDDYKWPLDVTNLNKIQPQMTIGGDDNIIRIIPRNYFINRGEYLYIGKEYGYYIKTVAEKYDELVYNRDNLKNLLQTLVRILYNVFI